MKKTVLLLASIFCSVIAFAQNSDITNPQEVYLNIMNTDDLTITWIRDNAIPTKMGKQVFNDTPDELLTQLGLQDGIPSSMSCFVMEVEGQTILFDTGLGSPTSLLPTSLRKIDQSPETIKTIFITHLHGDHIGGLMADGKKAFPNATIYINKVEYDAWMNMTGEKNKQQKSILEEYKNQLHLFNIGDELPAGIQAIEAYGHTPGHTVFQKNRVLIIGDIMHGQALQMKHPEYCPNFDMDKKQATESRKRILQYAQEKGLIMAGMHLPEGFIME